MAHLKMLETRQNPRERQRWKFQLVKGLYEQGYSREDVLKLFRFINWLISLPPELEQDFWRQVQQYQEEGQMPFITNLERVWLEQGIGRGRQQERHK